MGNEENFPFFYLLNSVMYNLYYFDKVYHTDNNTLLIIIQKSICLLVCCGYRFDATGEGRSSCQLTSVPSEHLDATLDFNADRDYDFFERDRNAPKSCSRPWSGLRPWTQYGSQRFDGAMGGYGGYGVGGYSMHHPPSDGQYYSAKDEHPLW